MMSMWEKVREGQEEGPVVPQGSRGRRVAALTSWSSFTRSCSCIRTVYSSSHLTDIGKGERTQPRVLLPLQLLALPPSLSGQGLRPQIGLPGWECVETRMYAAASQWAAAAVGWLHTSWQGLRSPSACPEPPDHGPGTIFKNNCHHFGPLQYPSPRGPSSASCLAGLIPHLLPTPVHQVPPSTQAPTFSGTDPVSRSCPHRTEPVSLLPCLLGTI